jgi:16S rRNA (uracil1498-N3)-methyltransferase
MIEKELRTGDILSIEGADAHHITRVLRLRRGDWIVLSNGRGARFRAEITSAGGRGCSALVAEKLPDIENTGLVLAQALIKHDRLEAIIQKAVELGVAKIIPFTSERTIPKYSAEGLDRKARRWRKIAMEAAKQCGTPAAPDVAPPISFPELIKASGSFKHKLMFYEGEEKNTLERYFQTIKPLNHRTIALIGPEGGFAPEEAALARRHGFTTLGLGPLILRVETAAIAALTLTQHFLGHFYLECVPK